VLLVNSLIFACLECKKEFYDDHELCPMPICGNPYRGHYILVIGYNAQLKVFLFKNPDSQREICYVPEEVLHKSRKSYGTQGNMLFIDLKAEGIPIQGQ